MDMPFTFMDMTFFNVYQDVHYTYISYIFKLFKFFLPLISSDPQNFLRFKVMRDIPMDMAGITTYTESIKFTLFINNSTGKKKVRKYSYFNSYIKTFLLKLQVT